MTTVPDEIYEKHQLIKHLVASIPCAICQHSNAPDNVHIVDHHGETWVMAIKCNHCGTKGLVFAMLKEEEPEVVADLTSQEWTRFREMPEINTDDVLDVHEFLRDFDGDFVSLLEGK